MLEEHGIALIGADGMWSNVARAAARLPPPEFRAPHRLARAGPGGCGRGGISRSRLVHLWLGHNAHLVHYPVKGGALINIVAIVHDEWNEPGWSAAGDRDEMLRALSRAGPGRRCARCSRMPDRWQKWALYDRAAVPRGEGPVTLLGDAAHPMLPFLAQGAGMAIEDAAVLADMLARTRRSSRRPAPLRRRAWHRTARAQQMLPPAGPNLSPDADRRRSCAIW